MVELPSGRKVEIRRMKLSDEDIILNSKTARKDETTDILLESISNVSYEDLQDMLIGDRAYMLIAFRKLSKGNMFYPKAVCPYCKHRWDEEIDLDALEVQSLDSKKVNKDYEFELTLPISGATLTMRLLTGKEEKELKRIKKNYPDKLMSFLMLLRTKSINVAGEEVQKNVEWFRNLDSEDTDFMRDAYDEHDCGVNTSVEVMCPSCDAVFDYEVPFDSNFFFQTRRTTKSSKKRFRNF